MEHDLVSKINMNRMKEAYALHNNRNESDIIDTSNTTSSRLSKKRSNETDINDSKKKLTSEKNSNEITKFFNKK